MDAPQTVPRLPIALTMGDAAGIGPELAILAWRDRKLHGLSPFAIYADLDLMRSVAASLGSDLPIADVSDVGECAGVFDRALPVVPVALNQPARAGEPTPANGAATILSIKRAVADVAAKRASAVVTNPIAKAVLYQAGFEHPGHTEYLGELAKEFWPAEPAQPVMMLCSSQLRVVPVTIHVAAEGCPCPADDGQDRRDGARGGCGAATRLRYCKPASGDHRSQSARRRGRHDSEPKIATSSDLRLKLFDGMA